MYILYMTYMTYTYIYISIYCNVTCFFALMHQHKLLRCHWFSLIPYWWQKSSFHIIRVQFWHPPMLLNQTGFHKHIRYQKVTKEYQWSNTTPKSDWGHTWSVLVKSSRAVKSFTQTCQMCWTRTTITVIIPGWDRSSMRQPVVVTFFSRKNTLGFQTKKASIESDRMLLKTCILLPEIANE